MEFLFSALLTLALIGAPASIPQLISEDVPGVPANTVDTGVVILDGTLHGIGKISGLRMLYGQSPYLDGSLRAARGWSFASDDPLPQTQVSALFLFRARTTLPSSPFSFTLENKAPSSDHGPIPTAVVDPGYPIDSTGEGVVILQLGIDVAGNVQSVDTIRREPSLDEAAAQAVRSWHFTPAMENGKPVAGTCIAVISFQRPALYY